jgi:U3 small nucleolar RNA-associated protein 11
LRALKAKAADRNPDEFSFKMMSTKAENGRKVGDRGNKALSMGAVKLLKTQDAGYVRTMLQATRKEREKLEDEVVLGKNSVRTLKEADGATTGSHMVFVDSVEEGKQFQPEEWFGTTAEGLSRVWNRPRDSAAAQEEAHDEAEERQGTSASKLSRKQHEIETAKLKEELTLKRKRERAQESRTSRLEALKARERDLRSVENELETQRAKMAGTIGGVNRRGVQFKIRERKR